MIAARAFATPAGAGPSAPPPPCDAKAARDFSSEAGLPIGLTGLSISTPVDEKRQRNKGLGDFRAAGLPCLAHVRPSRPAHQTLKENDPWQS